ncbi:MAG: hypothetical protein ACRDMH_12685 [Solirubrobacterales bacterium]
MVSAKGYMAAQHEAGHTTAAYVQGWPVDYVVRQYDGSGETLIKRRYDGDIRERVLELIVIKLMGYLEVPDLGSRDLEQALALDVEPGLYDEGNKRAKAMSLTPRYRAIHAALLDELLVKPAMTHADIAAVIARVDR